jgi:hypothetical protein
MQTTPPAYSPNWWGFTAVHDEQSPSMFSWSTTETDDFSETLVSIYQTIRRHITENCHLYIRPHEKFKHNKNKVIPNEEEISTHAWNRTPVIQPVA